MIKPGIKLRYQDSRDRDLLKTFGAVNFPVETLPNRYSADAGLTMPDQNADGYPNGCTGYAQADLCTDEDATIYDSGEFYLSTPPGGSSTGRAMRDSLKLLTTRGPKTKDGKQGDKRTAYYSINATGILDWMDAIRVGLFIVRQERRSASVAIPWFPEFEVMNSGGILREDPIFDWSRASGHDAKIAGWTDVKTDGTYIRNGELFLMVKSWQGIQYGDKGWCYMSRVLANAVFNMTYTEAFTVTKMSGVAQTVDMDAVDRVVSFIQSLLIKLHLA